MRLYTPKTQRRSCCSFVWVQFYACLAFNHTLTYKREIHIEKVCEQTTDRPNERKVSEKKSYMQFFFAVAMFLFCFQNLAYVIQMEWFSVETHLTEITCSHIFSFLWLRRMVELLRKARLKCCDKHYQEVTHTKCATYMNSWQQFLSSMAYIHQMNEAILSKTNCFIEL